MKTSFLVLLAGLILPLNVRAEGDGPATSQLPSSLGNSCKNRDWNQKHIDHAGSLHNDESSECKSAMKEAKEVCWGKINQDNEKANNPSEKDKKVETEKVEAAGAGGTAGILKSKTSAGQEKAIGYLKSCDEAKSKVQAACDAEEAKLKAEQQKEGWGSQKGMDVGQRIGKLKNYRRYVDKSFDDEINCQGDNLKALAAVEADAQATMASAAQQETPNLAKGSVASDSPTGQNQSETEDAAKRKAAELSTQQGLKQTATAVGSGAATNAARTASHGLAGETTKEALRSAGKMIGENAGTISGYAGAAAKKVPLVEPAYDIGKGVVSGNPGQVAQGVAVGAACLAGGQLICLGAGAVKLGYNYFNQPNCSTISDPAVALSSSCPMSVQSVNSAIDILAQK